MERPGGDLVCRAYAYVDSYADGDRDARADFYTDPDADGQSGLRISLFALTEVEEMSMWLPIYGRLIKEAADAHGIEPARLAALVWQETDGGLDPRTGIWLPQQLYRYEAAFWDRYLAHQPEYAAPAPASLEPWKRRVSASYGIGQVLYATARGTVCHSATCPNPYPHGYRGQPEGLFEPSLSLFFAAEILAHALQIEHVDWRAAWLHYNGGGRPAYATEAEQKYEAVLAINSPFLK